MSNQPCTGQNSNPGDPTQTSEPVAAPLPPKPHWADRSMVEDGGITHEWITPIRPHAWTHPADVRPTDVSVSVHDHWDGHRWTRREPSVQIEGGSFSIGQATQLRAAVDDVLQRLSAGNG